MKIKHSYLYVPLMLLWSVKASKAAAGVIFDFKPAIAKTDFTIILVDMLKWILGVAGSIALIFLIFAGIMYMTAMGDQQKATSAKKSIKWTLVGLFLVLASYAILIIINNIFT